MLKAKAMLLRGFFLDATDVCVQHLFRESPVRSCIAAPTAQRSSGVLGPIASAPCAVSGTGVLPPDGYYAFQLHSGDTLCILGPRCCRRAAAPASRASPWAVPTVASGEEVR